MKSIEAFYRYCPACSAASSDVGSVPFRCRECGFAQFFGPVAAVGALVVDRCGKLLLVKRARDPGKGKWGLPGGFVDRDETAEEAMRREVREETQLEVEQASYLVSYPNQYNYRGEVSPVIDLFFTATVCEGQTVTLEEAELQHHVWADPPGDYLDHMAFPSNRKAIEDWLKIR